MFESAAASGPELERARYDELPPMPVDLELDALRRRRREERAAACARDVERGFGIPVEEQGSLPWADAPATAAPVEASAPVRALLAAVDAVAAARPADLSETVALADAAALLRAGEQLRAAVLGRLADVDTRSLHQLAGAPSTGTWVAEQHTSLDRSEVTLARRLATLPQLQDAVTTGRLSINAARRVSRALTTLRPLVDRPDGLIDGQPGDEVVTAVVTDGVRGAVCQALGGLADDDPRLTELIADLSQIACWPTSQHARLEAAFTQLATLVEPAQLPGALGELVDALLPTALEDRAADGTRDRGLVLRRKDDGSGWLITRGELDLETGELLHTVLTAAAAVDPDNPLDTDAYRHARRNGWDGLDTPTDTTTGCDSPRSRAQRQHDALKLALRSLLDHGTLGSRGKTAPHLAVTLDLGALTNKPGATPARASSGTRLPASLLRSWLCDAHITRFVLSLGHRVRQTSHSQRTLTAHERHIKHLETGGHCQGAGCTRGPGHRLIPHHTNPWPPAAPPASTTPSCSANRPTTSSTAATPSA